MPVFKRFGKEAVAQKKKAEDEEASAVDEEEEEASEAESEEPIHAAAVDAASDDEEVAFRAPLKMPKDWVERLQVTASAPLKKGEWNVDDDGMREELFEAQALKSVEMAVQLLKQNKVPYRRPADYYAEMVKSDTHMAKIQETMDYEKNRIESQQQRRAQKQQKKFGKQVQNQVLADREAEKAQAFAKIEHLKKKAKAHGMASAKDDDIDVAFGGDGDEGGAKTQSKKRKTSLTPGKAKKARR